ncbi:hypothetical protein GGI25_001825 [Coemansia spiralis]|uniref:Survival Motor Neuron Gemin2-binding domain-containing protein n=2 Tax=Coemansia TaxID=4863 RepID=A0A9W8G9K6_9FUNG|nr:hypothetical protein EDC05_001881 [Coemansia umbellata]KAJ2622735.1 hypothetical protein GGI26_003004 [Coemansia sp. RSA 1358]KAJ2679053.1 hypothetical protein GGI25_001825 [Coemansia spiralis]
MAGRQIVSYDDLFTDTENEAVGLQGGLRNLHPDQASDSSSTSDDGMGSSAIAHPDAWDDSELIRAWDSAIGDYRKHHADLLGDETYLAQRHRESAVGEWEHVQSATAQKDEQQAGTDKKRKRKEAEPTESVEQPGGGENEECAAELGTYPEPPQSEEEALYKLNMAWYYAGYYAGYYQVSRKHEHSADKPKS